MSNILLMYMLYLEIYSKSTKFKQLTISTFFFFFINLFSVDHVSLDDEICVIPPMIHKNKVCSILLGNQEKKNVYL